MVNANMTDYVIPTAVDAPPIRVVFLEQPLQRLPHGAKGLGELPHEGPAPAVANALRQALNGDFTAIPITPETILAKLPGSGEGSESQTAFRAANRPLARLG
jgi:CO/xanthine dehydrogenase Mo-binding subunit